MTSQLVVGAGQVGSAVAAVLDCPVRDVDPDPDDPDTVDVLHIAFPWSGGFTDAVAGYQDRYDPAHVVVHSTVPVGTCDAHGWVHSPVRGRHPHLTEGLTSFVKHFGGDSALGAALDCWPHPFAVHQRARDTEAGKLWELAQYGINIAVEKQIHAWCETHDVDFDVAYTTFAETYNAGWRRLGEDRFVRPVLEHMPGPIGGHCVVENADLLDHWLTDLYT